MFGAIRNRKSNWNIFIRVLLILVILLLVAAIIFTMLIPKRFESYQLNHIDNVVKEVNEAVSSREVENIVKVKNEYSIDIIVFERENAIYSSNGIYEVEVANRIYSDGYIYKSAYENDGFLIWLIVYSADVSTFINESLTQNIAIVIFQTLVMLIILYIITRKSIKPLSALSEIVIKLKNSTNALHAENNLDEISAELVKVSNDLKLQLYYTKKEEQEFERRYNQQTELLYEQKNYLANVVHDVKGTFAAIKFSSQLLNTKKNFSDLEKKAVKSIENSSVAALELVTKSLDNVINDKYNIYIDKQDVNIRKSIEQYFEYNNMLLYEKKLELNVTGEEIVINVNVIKFDQILNNILSNMIKYSKEKSTLNIKLNSDICIFENAVSKHR